MVFKLQQALFSAVFFFHRLVLHPVLDELGILDVSRQNRVFP